MAVSGERLDALESISWPSRIQRGIESEQRFAKWLADRGFQVCHLEHEGHNPDLYTPEMDTYWQVKDGLRSGGQSMVIAEAASIDRAFEMEREGRHIAIVWEMPGGSWKGQTPSELHIRGEISEDSRRHGSGTPAYKILKGNLILADDLILKIENSKIEQLRLPW